MNLFMKMLVVLKDFHEDFLLEGRNIDIASVSVGYSGFIMSGFGLIGAVYEITYNGNYNNIVIPTLMIVGLITAGISLTMMIGLDQIYMKLKKKIADEDKRIREKERLDRKSRFTPFKLELTYITQYIAPWKRITSLHTHMENSTH